jgi:hypothetical protein
MELSGYVKLEGTKRHIQQVKDGSGLQTRCSNNGKPTYSIFGADFSSVLINGSMRTSSTLSTGDYMFEQTFRAASGFAAGNNYAVRATWLLKSGSTRSSVFGVGVN